MGLQLRRSGLDRCQHIVLGQSRVLAGADDRRRIEIIFADQATHRRCHRSIGIVAGLGLGSLGRRAERCSGVGLRTAPRLDERLRHLGCGCLGGEQQRRARAFRLGRRRRLGGRFGGEQRRGLNRLRRTLDLLCRSWRCLVDETDRRADGDDVTDLDQVRAHNPVDRRGYFDGDLVGLEADDRLVRLDWIARHFQPLADGSLGNRFAEWRDGDADCHDRPCWFRR